MSVLAVGLVVVLDHASRRAIRRTGAIRRKSKITICDTKKSRTMTASHPTTLNTQLNVDIPK